MRGGFITLEGTEGVGKSTCLEIVEELISAEGCRVLTTREPGGTALGEKIREWILEGQHSSLLAETEVLLMFAARSHHLDEVIRPALSQGHWVICDRFTDATFAYQGGGRQADLEWLKTLKTSVQRGLEPDLTLLLDAPIKVGLERISSRDLDHFEREDLMFFERVRETYLDLAHNDSTRIKVIDAAQPMARVQAQISKALKRFLRDFRASE